MPVGEPLPVVVPETARRVEMGSSIAPPATGEQSG
ncbi:unannotated protein [freshwater metagenome]|uniref:Unannotated protein n=1 Tax=freshwater metagenome TaxID=449393 RepID=A0A6J6QEH4_9ZZZZ